MARRRWPATPGSGSPGKPLQLTVNCACLLPLVFILAPRSGDREGAANEILAAAGVRYEDWIKFTLPLYLALIALGAVSIAIAIAIGLQ